MAAGTARLTGRHLRDLLGVQCGVVSRRQLLDLGWTDHEIDHSRRGWTPLLPGVFLAQPVMPSGSDAEQIRIWAAILNAGPGATASHTTALRLLGALDRPVDKVHLTVPAGRNLKARPGIHLHRSRSWAACRSRGSPPRTSVERALLDSVDQAARAATVIDLVLRVTQRRLSTPARLRAEMAVRPRLRWRELMAGMLAEVEDGVASVLELEYRKRVEEAHGLPEPDRNRPERLQGSTRYRDVRYPAYGVVVELDGKEAHPDDERHRDRARDNATTVGRLRTLRYGWLETYSESCGVAGQVVGVLRDGGWIGRPKACGEGCVVTEGRVREEAD